ncbi:MAG: M56 family metallopeptidase, partial [Verrucomicrobiales bacterium]
VAPASTFPWLGALKWLWLGGVAIGLFKLALSGLGLRRWRRHSDLLERLEGGVELRMLESLDGPVAAGIFRKVVYVPSAWRDWDRETRTTVLLHELAHHRRRDPLVRGIGAMVVAIHWFNPLVRWMLRRLALQCEQACDRQVISNGVPSDRYAKLLCRFASDRGMPAGALAMAEQSSLEQRVRHLMQPKHTKGFITVAVLALITVGGAGVLALGGSKSVSHETPDRAEVELRLSADPFPADHP